MAFEDADTSELIALLHELQRAGLSPSSGPSDEPGDLGFIIDGPIRGSTQELLARLRALPTNAGSDAVLRALAGD